MSERQEGMRGVWVSAVDEVPHRTQTQTRTDGTAARVRRDGSGTGPNIPDLILANTNGIRNMDGKRNKVVLAIFSGTFCVLHLPLTM
jgi:hypothetical protein